jgi:FkbM family methyltransferase
LRTVPAGWFLELRRIFRSVTGRELGFAHATRLLANVLPDWQSLPLQGPDELPIHVDLRVREGYFATGFGNTIEHMDALLPFVHDGDVVMDVGANIGVWSRHLLGKRRLSKIVAFEPAGRNYELLVQNLASYPMACCEAYAVGRTVGLAEFSTDRDSGQNHLVSGDARSVHVRTVEMTSLDAWSQQHDLQRLDLLKIDVEGCELEVFEGATALLARFKPVLYFEHVPKPGGDVWATPCTHPLASLGYTVRAVLADGRLVDQAESSAHPEFAFSHDLIAVPPTSAGR